jgi:uncharacterized repeat protein (TIGR03943 family)
MQQTHENPFGLHEHHEPLHVKPGVRDWLRAAVLVGLGLYFVYNIISGSLTNYINERFAWLSYLAAAVYLLLGARELWALLRGGGQQHHHHHHHDEHDHARDHAHHDHDHGHSHAPLSWFGLLIVSVPLVLGTLIPSRPLGASAIESVNFTNASAVGTAEEVTVPPEQRSVLDWLRAFNKARDYAEFNNQPADVIGFVYREPGFAGDSFMVARFTISCCVADASPIGLPVVWSGAGELEPDTWVRVRGSFQVGDFREDRVPLLQAQTVEVVDQPKHPYLYP